MAARTHRLFTSCRYPILVCIAALSADAGQASEDAERVPALATPLPLAAPLQSARPLGFVLHWGQSGTQDYVSSGAPSMLTNLFSWHMRDEERQLVDFARAETWLRYLYRHGLTSAVIVDTSIHHTSAPWRSERTKARDENVVDQNGRQTKYSSPLSPEYRRMVDQYIRDLTGWVSKIIPTRVTTYVNGAEVFWPGVLDAGPLAAASFRDWLTQRYGGLEEVNRRWRSRFKRKEDIPVLPVWRTGDGEHAPRQFVFSPPDNGAWVTALTPVSPGAVYAIAVDVLPEADSTSCVEALVAWTADNHPPEHSPSAKAVPDRRAWQRLDLRVTAPEWAQRGSLYLHVQGRGSASWRQLSVSLGETGQSAVANSAFEPGEAECPPGWATAVWDGRLDFSAELQDGHRIVRLRGIGVETPVTGLDPGVFWHDFHTYSMEIYARTMNHWARRLHECDPSRQVMHYLGFLLGTLGQWDDLMVTQRPDIFLANAPDVDVHGLQLCAAHGDFHVATVNLDLARKHGKPMVATDLQDFTHGVHVGFDSLNHTTLACIAHGMRGAYYYCWYDHNLDYNWYQTWPLAHTRAMLTNADRCIAFLEGARPEVRTAFLLPVQAYSEADPAGGKSDMLDAMGWYKALCQAGLCADVVTPYELAHGKAVDLSPYRLVIVPDCPVLSGPAFDALGRYLAAGGHVLLGGRSPAMDETGRDLPGWSKDAPLPETGSQPGAFRVGEGRLRWVRGAAGRVYLGDVRRFRVAGNTPPLYQPDGEWRWPRTEGKPLLETIRQEARLAGAVAVWLEPPDPKVEIVPYRKDGRWRIVMIHTGQGMHRNGTLVLPQAPESPPNVWADFGPKGAQTVVTETNRAAVELPPFRSACLVEW